ncbi:MAG: hypothetical protein ACYSTG_09105 [Planctomycetota bacterium]|jgi:hypothetical protein
MNERNEENLKDLFEKFVDAEEAEKAAEDIRKGEEILSAHPGPEPDGEVIAGIKAEVARELLGRKTRVTKRVVYKVAAVAAAFLIVAAVSVKLFERGGEEQGKVVTASILPSAIWESEDLAADDVDLAILTAEIREIEEDALALQLGENGGNGHIDLEELEIELMEISNDFWKG